MNNHYASTIHERNDAELLFIVIDQRSNYKAEIVKAAEEEINKRGGVDYLKSKTANNLSEKIDETVVTESAEQNHAVTNKEEVAAKPQRPYIRYAIFVAVFLLLTLPFHYVPQHWMMFPKDNFTFSNTLIFQSDIDRLLERCNNASLFEKASIADEPLFRKLKEKGLIYFVNEPSTQNPFNQFNNETSPDDQQQNYSEEDKTIIEKVKAKVKRDFPDNYTMQKITYDQAVADYFYLKSVSDQQIKKQVERDYPLDFTMQKLMYNQELDAKEQMK